MGKGPANGYEVKSMERRKRSIPPRRAIAITMGFVLSSMLGCADESPAEPALPPSPTEPTAAAPAAPSEPAGPEVIRETYALAAHPEAEGYAAGELGQFEIVLEGRSGWHLNQEYPIAVELSGPDGVRFEKARLERGDAAEFGESKARFSVALTPNAAGEQPVRAQVAFAMCTDENCTMHDETLALVLPVR
jgi:hypothetical protein